MRLAVCSITHHSVHSVDMVRRHVLDWRLQTDKRFHLFLCHDGPVEGREDRVSLEDIDWGDQASFVIYPERRRFWGAYCRQEWLHREVGEPFTHVYFCCGDDQVAPTFVEKVLKEFEDNKELIGCGINLSHHHYSHQPIPLGTYPTVNRSDWASFVWDLGQAKKVGIQAPEEFACDGIFHADMFSSIQCDESKIKILPNILVFKN